jgi:predicted TIM-barrel fold metal-dependent hydrolase
MSLPTAAPVYGHQLHAGRDESILDPHLPIIDSHIHLFDRPPLGDRPPLRYMVDEYLADAKAGHRIVASVYVEIMAFARRDGPEILRPLGEIEFANGVGAMAASGIYGDCRACAAIVGHADLRVGDSVAELLDRAMDAAPERFRGIRQVSIDHPTDAPYRYITHRPPRGILQAPGFRKGFQQLVQRGLSFDAAMFHHQLQDLIDLADAFPNATLVLNHCGHAIAMDLDDHGRAEVFREWNKLMREVARRPNIYCKIGGLGLPMWGFGFEERRDPVGYLELASAWRPWVETSIELFGAQRCMMESNYPPDGRSAGFVPLWNAMKHLVRNASTEDKAALFHGTAAKVYRIQLPDLLVP